MCHLVQVSQIGHTKSCVAELEFSLHSTDFHWLSCVSSSADVTGSDHDNVIEGASHLFLHTRCCHTSHWFLPMGTVAGALSGTVVLKLGQ